MFSSGSTLLILTFRFIKGDLKKNKSVLVPFSYLACLLIPKSNRNIYRLPQITATQFQTKVIIYNHCNSNIMA